MNAAIILAGGIGTRMGIDKPKQYYEVNGKPIIYYSMRVFDTIKAIDKIVIVADAMWRGFITDLTVDTGIKNFGGFADPGETRQFSIFNALKYINATFPEMSKVIVHDAARPFVEEKTIVDCIEALDEYDGAIPVLPVKDTCYLSEDGECISQLIDRKHLFAGQAPEGFIFEKYYRAHNELPREKILKFNGSSEIAYACGMKIKMIAGTESNFKITTKEDLEKCEMIMGREV